MKYSAFTIRLLRRAALGVAFTASSLPAWAGDVSIGIRIGEPSPPPVVIVREREPERVVIVEERAPVVYESYVVGYRRNLYDADLRLRVARAEEWDAHQELDAARRHEGELAVRMDEQGALVEELRHHGGDPAKVAAIHARVADTADLAADLHKRLAAFDHRIGAAREDLEAAKTLHDRDGAADAADRLKSNEVRAAATAAELHEAEERLAHLQKEEAEAKAMAADTERLHAAEDAAAETHHKLEVAHDAVYATQKRLTAAQDEVYAALHDRDEALWLLHRDEIIAGRFEPERCGFVIDLSIWGGHMPRDPEVIHAYCVHDVHYWRADPIRVEERVVVVERVTEVTRIREIQKVREVDRIQRVEKVERVVKVEDRRRVAEVAVVERKRYEAETVERKTAVAEHRAPRPVYVEKPAVVKPVAHVSAEKQETHAAAPAPTPEKHAGAMTKADTVAKAQAEESGKAKPSAEHAEKSSERASEKVAEKRSEKASERASEKVAEKDKVAEKEKVAEKPSSEGRGSTEGRGSAESRRPVASDSDSSSRRSRRGDPVSDSTPPSSGKQKGGSSSSDGSRNSRDPRDPRYAGDSR